MTFPLPAIMLSHLTQMRNTGGERNPCRTTPLSMSHDTQPSPPLPIPIPIPPNT